MPGRKCTAPATLTFAVLPSIEESLEAAGLIVFLYASLRLAARERALPDTI